MMAFNGKFIVNIYKKTKKTSKAKQWWRKPRTEFMAWGMGHGGPYVAMAPLRKRHGPHVT